MPLHRRSGLLVSTTSCRSDAYSHRHEEHIGFQSSRGAGETEEFRVSELVRNRASDSRLRPGQGLARIRVVESTRARRPNLDGSPGSPESTSRRGSSRRGQAREGIIRAERSLLSSSVGTPKGAGSRCLGENALYAVPFSTLGGAGLRTFAVVAGNLPPGITLYSYSGTFAGTPTQAGVYNFTVRVTDGICEAATSIFTLNVQSPATPTPTATPVLGNHVFLPFVPSDCVDCG